MLKLACTAVCTFSNFSVNSICASIWEIFFCTCFCISSSAKILSPNFALKASSNFLASVKILISLVVFPTFSLNLLCDNICFLRLDSATLSASVFFFASASLAFARPSAAVVFSFSISSILASASKISCNLDSISEFILWGFFFIILQGLLPPRLLIAMINNLS